MKVSLSKIVETEVKTISLHVKTRDSISGCLKDEKGDEIASFEDQYTPCFFPGEHYGDYLMLDIDLDTGKILNWKKPAEKEIASFYNLITDQL